jgi:hypothetical protein
MESVTCDSGALAASTTVQLVDESCNKFNIFALRMDGHLRR